ncbi:hypothetical protein [Roseiflexus sp.]|uniref:hypothetical protein n=1 Tax=Roseiflexus sp. TaxID=2562120 RepID=UPI00258C9FF1|nr:hypothetical protein [Roseiflexus sp.]
MIGVSNLDVRLYTLDMEISLIIYEPATVTALYWIVADYVARSQPAELHYGCGNRSSKP